MKEKDSSRGLLPIRQRNLEITLSAGVGVAPKIIHRRCKVRAHATPTPVRLPARGMEWNDWRELANAGNGTPCRPGAADAISRQRSARRAGLHGEGSCRWERFGVRRMSRQETTIEAATAPRTTCARATGATPAGAFSTIPRQRTPPP